MKRLLIVGCSRSGTTALESALRKHSSVAMAPSELHVDNVFKDGVALFLTQGVNSRLRSDATSSAFDMAAGIEAKSHQVWKGGKVATNQSEQARLIVREVVGWERGLHVIHIEREDEIARLASMMFARFSNAWHVTRGDKRKVHPQKKLWISKRSLCHSIVESHLVNTSFRELQERVPYLRVSYEDFVQNNEAIIDEAVQFLGLENEGRLTSSFSKNLPDPMSFVRRYKRLEKVQSRCKNDLRIGKKISFSRMEMKLLRIFCFFEKLRFRFGF